MFAARTSTVVGLWANLARTAPGVDPTSRPECAHDCGQLREKQERLASVLLSMQSG
jgi:hypothetical protein